MKFLKKGIEYNKLAKGFNGLFLMINEIEDKIKLAANKHDFEEDLLIIAYLSRIEIIDRMEEYNWSMTTPISVPMISRARLTLTLAYQNTIARLYHISEELNISDEINEILDKGEAFYQIEKAVPNHLKNLLT